MLEHEGVVFTDTEETRELQIEREANIYSAVILMPDIVLLSKIYYSRDTFFQVQKSLGAVSYTHLSTAPAQALN